MTIFQEILDPERGVVGLHNHIGESGAGHEGERLQDALATLIQIVVPEDDETTFNGRYFHFRIVTKKLCMPEKGPWLCGCSKGFCAVDLATGAVILPTATVQLDDPLLCLQLATNFGPTPVDAKRQIRKLPPRSPTFTNRMRFQRPRRSCVSGVLWSGMPNGPRPNCCRHQTNVMMELIHHVLEMERTNGAPDPEDLTSITHVLVDDHPSRQNNGK